MDANTKMEKIMDIIRQGGAITISTHLKHIEVNSKTVAKFAKINAQIFKTVNDSLYIARGKNWDCIDYAKITAHI